MYKYILQNHAQTNTIEKNIKMEKLAFEKLMEKLVISLCVQKCDKILRLVNNFLKFCPQIYERSKR